MPFTQGIVSFRQFAIAGDAPARPDQDLLDKLRAHRFPPDEAREAVPPEEVEYGWSGGRHLYDAEFGFEHNVYGEHVLFALRIDTNQVPAEVRHAHLAIEEAAMAAGNPSGFISKLQKKEAKRLVDERLDQDRKTGKYRKSKLVPVLWDLQHGRVYAQAAGGHFEKLAEIFERTFKLILIRLDAATLADRLTTAAGSRKTLEDLRPTAFAPSPDGADVRPDYPWVSKQARPKAFLANEFLLWLWMRCVLGDGVFKTDAGEVTVFFDKSLDLDCAYGQTGKDSLRGLGVHRAAEAMEALRAGKVPRRASLQVETNKDVFSLSFDPENFGYGGVKLADVEGDTARVQFEERLKLLDAIVRAAEALFAAFLKLRTSGRWRAEVERIAEWILQPKAVAA